MTWMWVLVVAIAGVVVGAGLAALSRIRQRILAGNQDERLNVTLWLSWVAVAAITLGTLFGILHRAARWTDSEALATAGLLVACGAVGAAVVLALTRHQRGATSNPPL